MQTHKQDQLQTSPENFKQPKKKETTGDLKKQTEETTQKEEPENNPGKKNLTTTERIREPTRIPNAP